MISSRGQGGRIDVCNKGAGGPCRSNKENEKPKPDKPQKMSLDLEVILSIQKRTTVTKDLKQKPHSVSGAEVDHEDDEPMKQTLRGLYYPNLQELGPKLIEDLMRQKNEAGKEDGQDGRKRKNSRPDGNTITKKRTQVSIQNSNEPDGRENLDDRMSEHEDDSNNKTNESEDSKQENEGKEKRQTSDPEENGSEDEEEDVIKQREKGQSSRRINKRSNKKNKTMHEDTRELNYTQRSERIADREAADKDRTAADASSEEEISKERDWVQGKSLVVEK